jgi:hypothetical protein
LLRSETGSIVALLLRWAGLWLVGWRYTSDDSSGVATDDSVRRYILYELSQYNFNKEKVTVIEFHPSHLISNENSPQHTLVIIEPAPRVLPLANCPTW